MIPVGILHWAHPATHVGRGLLDLGRRHAECGVGDKQPSHQREVQAPVDRHHVLGGEGMRWLRWWDCRGLIGGQWEAVW